MSSPFQIGFMGKNPMKTITLNDKDLNSTNSASSQPAAEISYEGQGGVDYENDPRFAENPEGQGGKDYEADDSVAKMKGNQGSHKMTAGEYGRHLDRHMKTGGHHDDSTPEENKKKTESVAKMTSPLNSYANPGGEVYLSDQPAFQKMQNDIQAAADKVMTNFGDDDMEASLDRRINRRVDRANHRASKENRDGTMKYKTNVTDEEGNYLRSDDPRYGYEDQDFLDKTEILRGRKTKVTNKITQKLMDYEADVIDFATDKDGGKARLQAKYPLGKPRKSTK